MCSERVPGRLLHWHAKTDAFFNSSFVLFARLWNDLPEDIQLIYLPGHFRHKVTELF